jgi:hypothetical protein
MSSGQRSPILVYLEGGFASPAGKGPWGLESQAITRAAWRFDTLTQRCRLVPLLGTGRKGPHRSLAVARRSFLGAITAALGGSGGSNSIPCAQVITTGYRRWGMWGGLRAGDRKLANHPREILSRAPNTLHASSFFTSYMR